MCGPKENHLLIKKNLILKTFAFSKVNHLIQSIGLSKAVLKHLNTMFFRFLLIKKNPNIITKVLLKSSKGKLCIALQKKAVLKS